MDKEKKSFTIPTGGFGLCNMTFIAFLVLKLCHVIDWSWWWITAPLWGPAAFVILMVVLVVGIGVFLESRK